MWQQYTFRSSVGSRPYFVYTPSSYSVGTAVPLFVMLHGCTQTAEDFAAGTQMNLLAEEYSFIVVYPQQTNNYNQGLCWNWFTPPNQSRNSGEPAAIAGIVQTITQTTSLWTIDARRIYIAGLSAGGTMAAIMGATYPDLFAAVGAHSALEYQAATSLRDGYKAMRQGGPDPVQQGQAAYKAMGRFTRVVPTIVFHGTNDPVVSPINGDQLVRQWMQTDHLASYGTYNAYFNRPTSVTPMQVPGGHASKVYAWNDNGGNEIQEYWRINNMGHAWSGGSPSGSYTDSRGPGASEAMYAFFMSHSNKGLGG